MPANSYFKLTNHQAITVAVGSVACALAFGPYTTFIRISTGPVGVWYTVGVAPVATVADVYLPPNWTEIIGCSPGDKIAVIQPTAPSGTFSVADCVS